jgi:hypothetical protein
MPDEFKAVTQCYCVLGMGNPIRALVNWSIARQAQIF